MNKFSVIIKDSYTSINEMNYFTFESVLEAIQADFSLLFCNAECFSVLMALKRHL
jgi:hypothetical protein